MVCRGPGVCGELRYRKEAPEHRESAVLLLGVFGLYPRRRNSLYSAGWEAELPCIPQGDMILAFQGCVLCRHLLRGSGTKAGCPLGRRSVGQYVRRSGTRLWEPHV